MGFGTGILAKEKVTIMMFYKNAHCVGIFCFRLG